MPMVEEVVALLSDPVCVSEFGLEFNEITARLHCRNEALNAILRHLAAERRLLSIPIRRGQRWYLKYYVPPPETRTTRSLLEEAFTQLAVPPWIDVSVFRGPGTIFVGNYGKPPGFKIIHYAVDPPLVFRDRHAGGAADEIIFYKRRSKYRCSRGGVTRWYNLHGQQVEEGRKV